VGVEIGQVGVPVVSGRVPEVVKVVDRLTLRVSAGMRNDLVRRGCGQAAVRWAITSVFSSVHSTSPGRREATKHSNALASSASP